MEFYSEVSSRWKISIALSVILTLFVFTPAGYYTFGWALPAIWLALALAIALFTVLSFAAKEEKRKRSLIAIGLGLSAIAFPVVASWLSFNTVWWLNPDAFTL